MISRMLIISIFHCNGLFVIRSLSVSTNHFIPSKSLASNIIPTNSKNTVVNGVYLEVGSVTNPSALVATARIIAAGLT